MPKLENILIPAKFLSIMMHLVVTTMIFFSYPDNIKTTYPSITSKQDTLFQQAKVSVLAANSLTIILLAVEMVIHFSGNNLFRQKHNIFIITTHMIGIMFYSSYIFQMWNFFTLWYIFLVFSLMPCFVQIFTTISSGLKYRRWN